MSETFAARASDVVHETIDGETVIIDMARGTYYRLEGAAAQAWLRLASGASEAELRLHLSERFEATDAELESAVAAFLAELEGYALVERRAGAAANGVRASAAHGPLPSARVALGALAVHRFTDLEELFLIDPVHEVDETGWPAPPAPR